MASNNMIYKSPNGYKSCNVTPTMNMIKQEDVDAKRADKIIITKYNNNQETRLDGVTLQLYREKYHNLNWIRQLSCINTLSDIKLDNCSIDIITGILDAVNLRTLHISNSNITNLSFLSKLPHLTELYLTGIGLTDLSSLTELVNLTVLNVNNNNITDLSPLTGLVNLTVLNVNNNNITDLSPLTGLVNLTRLEICNNNVSDLTPICSLVKLKILHINNTKVVYLPSDIEKLIKLNTLTHDDNITNLDEFSRCMWAEDTGYNSF